MLTKVSTGKSRYQSPHTFANLMEMYEANYIRLRLLCGDMRQIQNSHISHIGNGVPIQLAVLEQCRHTTTLQLDYLFQDGLDRKPNLVVRIYHDARQAEVISRQCKLSGAKKYANEHGVALDEMLVCRWQLNRFLYKWLGYMRYQGHSFVK